MLLGLGLCAKPTGARWQCWSLLLVWFATSATAEEAAKPLGEAQVDLVLHVTEAKPSQQPIAEVVAMPADGERAPQTVLLKPGEQGSLGLQAGTWQIYAQADGFWGPSLPFISTGTGHFVLTLNLIPTVSVTGMFRLDPFPKGAPVTARFRQRETPKSPSREQVSGVVRCVVVDPSLRFTCPVPVGVHELRIRVDGHVSHFFRSHRVSADQSNDLGVLRMTAGASLVGQVVTEDGMPIEQADVLLSPDLADDASVGALRLRTDAEGFFHFQGIQPGIFGLRIAGDGLLPLEIPGLSIRAGNEAEISAPLILRAPAAYQISVTPPVDPRGEPWIVQLLRGRTRHQEIAAIAPGRWQIENASAGHYELLVLDTERNRVASEPLVLEPGQELIQIDLPLVSVVGSVTLGDEPIAGRVVFGSIQGAQSVRLAVDEEGTFRGLVPRNVRWDIDIMAESPAVVRRLRQIEGKEEADGLVRFDLELPDTVLAGRVVDAEGEPMAESLVVVLQRPYAELPSFQHTDSEGRFALHGLGFSTYAVTAEKVLEGSKRESAPVEVELASLSPSREIEIVLAGPEDVVRGTVVFDQGPVSGALVTLRGPIVPGTSVSKAVTGADGGFELRVPPGAASIQLGIRVPGSVMARLSVSVTPVEPLRIDLAGYQTGALILLVDDPVAAEGTSSKAWASLPWLVDSSSEVYSWADLSSWSARNGEAFSAGRLVVPFMPAGTYRLCRGTKPDCVTGTLTRGSRLALGALRPESANE